jgi:hypothetical protein
MNRELYTGEVRGLLDGERTFTYTLFIQVKQKFTMSERAYLKALNKEISKLNYIIDRKILDDADYRREARRHKVLLSQLRRDESRRRLSSLFRSFFPLWH